MDTTVQASFKSREPSVNKVTASSKTASISTKNQQFAANNQTKTVANQGTENSFPDAKKTDVVKKDKEEPLNLGQISQNEQVYKKR